MANEKTALAQLIGSRIRMVRQAAGLTQEELGKQLFLTRSTINKYESGIINIGLDNIDAIALIVDCAPEYLLGRGTAPGNYNTTAKIETITAKEESLLERFRQYPEDKQDLLLSLLFAHPTDSDSNE